VFLVGRFTLSLTLIFVSVLLVVGLPVSADEPTALSLEKECVVVGRIQGTDVMLYQKEQAPGIDQPLRDKARIKGFEILNVTSGEWQPLSLSKEGYFCANIKMGQYDLRGRDCEGRPYLIHHFNVPLNMAVNLGTFRVETCDPGLVARERWHDYFRNSGWRVYREGSGHVVVHLKHDTSREAYEDCENWFAGCHEEVYEQFENVMARR
jgi:hypothetical protein